MDSTIELFWSGPSWNIPGTPWDIIGYSRACYRTGFYIRHLDMMVDAGPQKNGNPKTFLITHCHGDHIANIPFTIIPLDNQQHIDQPTIFVHEKMVDKLNNYINSMFSLNYNTHFKGSMAIIKGVNGGMIFDFITNNTKIGIEIFNCIHDVPTVSYGISTKKQLLKDEYFHLKGNNKAIMELKKQRIEFTKTVYEPNIVFIWDTSISILKNTLIFKYPVIMIECTFLYEDEYDKNKKHIHWRDLKPYVLEYSNIYFVLVHFSLRYTENEIDLFFKKEGLRNVKPWLQKS